MQTDYHYEYLLSLARAVVPQGWNVFKYCDVESIKEDKGVLNVELNRYGRDRRFKSNVHGTAEPIRYINSVGYTKVNIHCNYLVKEEQCVLLHELAHIAHKRLISFQTKQYKLDYAKVSVPHKDVHGKLFAMIVKIFVNRAIKKGYIEFSNYIVSKGGYIKAEAINRIGVAPTD